MDRSKSCNHQLERQVYSLQSQVLCNFCAQPVNEMLQGEYHRLKGAYRTVLPNCESSDCIQGFVIKEGRRGWIVKGAPSNNKRK